MHTRGRIAGARDLASHHQPLDLIARDQSAMPHAHRLRLRGYRSLRDEDFRRPVGEQWTVAVAFAHIQYWDGRAVGGLEAWRRFWRDLPPREALEHAIKTAEVLDRIVAELSPEEADAVARQRYRVLDRSLHRGQHLDEVDRALGR